MDHLYIYRFFCYYLKIKKSSNPKSKHNHIITLKPAPKQRELEPRPAIYREDISIATTKHQIAGMPRTLSRWM